MVCPWWNVCSIYAVMLKWGFWDMDGFLMKLNEFSQERAASIQLFCLVSLPHALQVTTQNTLSSDGMSGYRVAVSNLPLFPSKHLFFTEFILKYYGPAVERQC